MKALPDVIWMYWEDRTGQAKPPYLELCQQTIQHHSGSLRVEVVTPDTLEQWLPDFPIKAAEALPALGQKADLVRSRLLLHHGGLWLDADTIAFRRLPSLLSPLAEHEVAAHGREGGAFLINCIAAQPGSKLIQRWVDAQDAALKRFQRHEAKMSWTEVGSPLLEQMDDPLPWYSYPANLICPVEWRDWRSFVSTRGPIETCMVGRPAAVMLYNRHLGPVLKRWSAEDILHSDLLLSGLLRLSLEVNQVPDLRPGPTRHSTVQLHALARQERIRWKSRLLRR